MRLAPGYYRFYNTSISLDYLHFAIIASSLKSASLFSKNEYAGHVPVSYTILADNENGSKTSTSDQ